jgi:non-specific serine/threonine protein kinase
MSYGSAVGPPPAAATPEPQHRTAELRRSEAVQLFVQRARAVGGAEPTAGDLEVVAAICAQLDGLPLAIELAASRMRLLPLPDLSRRLRDRLTLLTGGARDLPQRQRTLRATLDWSFGLLDRRSQDLLAAVGVFVGPFEQPAAAAVSGVDAHALLNLLFGLVEHSMLDVEPGGQPRFRMLQTVREYALGRLAESGRDAAVRDRHLDHFLQSRLTSSASRTDRNNCPGSIGWKRPAPTSGPRWSGVRPPRPSTDATSTTGCGWPRRAVISGAGAAH